MEVLIGHVGGIFFIFVAGFSEVNKCGGSNKACSWIIFSKRLRKNPCLLLESSYYTYWYICQFGRTYYVLPNRLYVPVRIIGALE